MVQIFSIGFACKETSHYCLVRVKEAHADTEFHVTIMNDELERTFHRNNVCVMQDGRIVNEAGPEDNELSNIRNAIAVS